MKAYLLAGSLAAVGIGGLYVEALEMPEPVKVSKDHTLKIHKLPKPSRIYTPEHSYVDEEEGKEPPTPSKKSEPTFLTSAHTYLRSGFERCVTYVRPEVGNFFKNYEPGSTLSHSSFFRKVSDEYHELIAQIVEYTQAIQAAPQARCININGSWNLDHCEAFDVTHRFDNEAQTLVDLIDEEPAQEPQSSTPELQASQNGVYVSVLDACYCQSDEESQEIIEAAMQELYPKVDASEHFTSLNNHCPYMPLLPKQVCKDVEKGLEGFLEEKVE